MTNKNFFKSILAVCLIAFTLVAAFISCEVGLGEAVDVAAPVVKIATPPTAAVIRDTFAIAGTWSDDGSIKSVEVELRNTGTDKIYANFDPVLTMEPNIKQFRGDWYVAIDPITAKVPDGNYEATVTITDNGKHTTEITRTFIIDNTSPVMVLSRPSSSKTDSDNLVESYGQYLTLEGQAADDNDIEKIVINFYNKDAPETLLWTKELTSIPPTISLDVAKFLDKDVYTKIYGDEKAGEKYYYCTITAYDSAKRYPLAGQEKDDDELGNAESSYILWADWEKFQSDYQKASGGNTKLKVPDLYAIKAGTSASSTRSATETSLIDSLFEKAIACGSFKLNPENSPTFSISGLELGLSTDVENDRALTVQLTKGLDGLSLITDDMKVYLIPVTSDASGNEVLGEKLYPQTSEFQKKGDGQFLTKILKEDCKNAAGEAVNLEYGKTYIIGVDGVDSEGNKILPSFDGKQFYIKFKAKNVAPGLTITTPSPTTTYLKKGQTLKISGTTSVPDGYPTISITCKIGEETTANEIFKYKVTENDKTKIEGGLIFYKFEFEVPIDGNKFKFNQAASSSYVFDITADLEDMPSTRTKTVIYDTEGPTISIDSMLPTAEKFTGNEDGSTVPGEYLNGDVTMKVAILDDDAVQTKLEEGNVDRRPYFIIEDAETGEQIPFRVGSETSPTIKHYITTPAKQSFVIHTQDIASGTASRKIKVKIFAQDRAGNLGVDIEDKTNTAFEREYTVDQSTDIPVILPSNSNSLSLNFATKEALVEQMNDSAITVKKSILTAGSPLQIKLIDDDGIASSIFKISEKDTGDNMTVPNGYNQTYTNTPSETILEYTVPIISGKYKCYVSITDTMGNTKDKSFWIVATGAAPVVTVSRTTPDNKIITTNTSENAKTTITNEISIDSGYDKFTVTRQESGCTPVVLYGENGSLGSILNGTTFTDTFTPSAGRTANKVVYTVTDENSHDGTREFTYNVDNTKPVVLDTAQYPIVVPSNKQTQSASFRFTATAQDNAVTSEVSSGISKLQYTFDSTKATNHIVDVTGVSSLSETIVFAEDSLGYAFGSEGKKKIYIRAIDDVGNIGDWVEKEFMYDTNAPALNIASYKRGSEAAVDFAENAASKSFETGEAFTLSGTVSDNTGIQTFEIWQNDKKLNVTSAIISNGAWTISGLPKDPDNLSNTKVDSGTYVYTVKATDNSAFGADSAKTTEAIVTVKIDKTKPTVTIDLATNGNDSAAYGENSLKGSAYTFRGEAKDDPANTGDFSSGFDTLYYAFTKTETAPSTYSLFVKPTTSSWSIPMNLGTGSSSADTDDTLYEGKKYLWVKGVDKAGNWSEVKHVAFMIDQAEPVVTCAVYKNTENSATAADTDGIVYLNKATGATKYTLKGTVSDANGISRLTVDGEEVIPSGTSWSKEFNAQGNFVHEIVVYDKSGKTAATSKSKTITSAVMFDTTDPTATTDFDTTTTAKTKWLSGTGDTYINGTASDVGAGLDKLEIKVDSDPYAPIPLSANWSYKYSIPNGFAENDDSTYHSVTVQATDKAKNSKEYIYYFRYDKTPPSANLTLNRNGEFVKAADFTTGVTLSGNANDGSSRAVKSAIISVKKDGAAHSTIDVTSSLSTAAASFGNFTKNLTASDYADGLYLFTLEVKDKADNSPAAGSTLTASMTVDKTPPVISKVRFGELTSDAESLRANTSKSKISIQFTEKNPESAYYYINDGSVSSITGPASVPDADWINLKYTVSGETCTASKDISLNDGDGSVYFKVVDRAENVTYNTTLTYEVDTTKPDATLFTVDNETLNGTKLVNGSNDVSFILVAIDRNDNSNSTITTPEMDPNKIKSVVLSKIGSTPITGVESTKYDGPTSKYKIDIPQEKFSSYSSGTYAVCVTVTDTFDNSKEVELFSLDIDKDKPEIKSYTLDDSYDANKKENNKNVYYMNNKNKAFNLTYVAYDKRGIDKVTLTLKDSSGESLKTLTSTESTFTFSSSNWANDWKGWTGYVDAELSVTDKAKNTVASPAKLRIYFDTTAPVGLHAFDKGATPKDIYFRVGDQDRDDGSTTAANGTVTWDPEWSDALDKDVGGKYTAGTFGNKETIKIRGNFTENGSGVKMIYYKLFTEAPSATDITNLKNSPATYADGYFAPKPASETKRRVFYTGEVDGVPKNGTSGSKNYVEISSTYLTTISGFQEGNNYLVLVAEDNVGNTEVDTVSDGVNYYTINVDTLPPETTALTENLYSNKTEDLTLSFTVEDKINKAGVEPAGIKKVTVNIQGVANTSKDKEATLTNEKYEVTIPKADLPGVTGQANSYSISVTTVDKAGKGNTDTRSVGNLVVDLKAPDLEIGVISDAKVSTPEIDVNGELSISGTSSDETKLEKVEVSYKKKTGEDTWHSLTVTGTNNWSTTFDTKASGVDDNTEYTIRAIATDSSGNQTTATRDIKVNQNTDRPTVKFTNLTKENGKYILKYISTGTLEGSVSDDDGTSAAVVTKFLASTYSISNDTGWTESPTGTWTHSSYGTTVFSKTTGDFKFTPKNTADGPQDVYFYIEDNKGNVFYSMAAAQLKRPHQQWKDEVPADNAPTAALHYEKDSTAPRIQDIKVQAYDSSDAASGTEDSVTAATKLGGSTKQKAVFKIKAYDENDIDEIRLTLNYKLKADNSEQTYKITTKATHDGFTNSGSVPETGDYIWATGKIDVSTWKSDNVTGTIEAFDKNGLQSSASPVFFVDNDGPSVTVNSPSSTEELTGTQKFAGISTDSGSGITETAWIIPAAAQRAMTDAQLAALTWDANYNGTTSASSWEFELSGETLATNKENAITNNEGVYTIPFYVKATDALGNYTINRTKTIKYNPEGDRPKAKITYPNDSEYSAGNNYLTLGGAIRITGTAEIPSGTTTVKATYLQVIQGTGNSTDLSTYTTTSVYVSGLKYNNNPCYSVHTASQAATNLGFTNLNFATGVDSSKWWGIKVNNAASWNFTINNNGEMNPTSGTTNYVAIRACAVNEEGKVGAWTDWYYINIDNTAPTQEAFMYQFTNAPTQGCTAATILANTNIKASNAYSSGLYLKGDWYLTVKLDDESAIDSYEVKKGVDTLAAGTGYYASTKVSGSGNDGNEKIQYLFIPVDTSNPAVTYTVTVNDTEHSISKTYSLNIDNTAPVINSVYKGETYNAANVLNTTENKITDSNYIYTLGSQVTESASGFDRFVFYYVRAGDSYTNEVLLDPLITTGTSDSKVALSGLTARTITQGSTNYTLYAKAVTGTLGADGYTFTPTTPAEITANAHIRKGGLIEANGILRKIEDINSSTGAVTFDTSSGVTGQTDATVYFPYAQVVDNTATEATTDTTGNSFTFKTNSDDGDGMPEAVEGTKGTGYNLYGIIHSKNMPDGPCALVVLAFDKAGNVSGNTYPVKIENSAPRLAKVWLGTDLNSSNSWQSNEFVGYDLYNANAGLGVTTTKVKETQTIHTAATGTAFKIKDKLAVIAEIIGGNGNIMMVYGKDATDASSVAKATDNANVATVDDTIAIPANAADSIGTVTYNNASVSTSLKGFTLTSQQIAGIAANATISSDTYDGTGKKASFTFWDQTDELDQGSTSQNCVLHVDDFIVDLYDGVKPNVVINPFYWTSLTDNSIYGSENAQKLSDLQGHVELESNWTALADDGTTKLTSWDGKEKNQGTALDSDPKVSGKIVVRGTAYDDKVLNILQFSMTNFDSGATKTFATYNSGSDSWTISKVGTPAADPTMVTNYYEVTVTPDYLDQNGHKVNWEIAIDTSHLSDVAHIDTAFTVTALDKAGGSSADRTASETAGDATLHRPTYYMDVVPYITGLDRPSAKTNTHRSRRGKYQVVLNEQIDITGFNLPGTATDTGTGNALVKNGIKLQKTGDKAGAENENAIAVTTGAGITNDKSGMSFKAPATSGYIKAYTNNIPSINNYNIGNEMESEYSGDAWTDDVYLSVWKNDEYFHFSNDPISPSMDRVPNTQGQHRLYGGWGTNGSRAFASYPYIEAASSGTSGASSYKPTSTGNAPGPNNGGGNTTLTSQNAQGQTSGYGDPISYYDVITDSSGNRYNVIIDCWQGSGSGWGGNFVINRNGYSRHNGFNTTGYTFGSDAMRHVIERMGSGRSPDSADSSDGFDEIFNQFLNPRIALYNGSAYITYYDRYAKCLKWAMSTPADSTAIPVTKYSTEGVVTSSTYSTNHYTTGGMVVAGYDTLQTGGSKTNLNVGMWSDIAIDTTEGQPVIAYYDSTNRRLMVATSEEDTYPVNTNSPILANGTTDTAPADGEGDAWSRQVVTGSAAPRLGEYVSLALDGGNNIHIACKGGRDSCLYYVYGERSDYGTYTWTTVCVDNNGSPGTWTDIKLTDPSASGAAAGPVISYYDPTNDATEDALKVAYLESTTSNTVENWDTMTVPCNTAATANRITLVLDVTDGETYSTTGTSNNSDIAVGYVSSRFDCVYLRKE